MALKKRTRVSAEFNMSSLTDIIFLLLIFFMLTSTVVSPNALNLKLPGRADTPASPDQRNLPEVRISGEGSLFLDRRRIDLDVLAGELRGVESMIIAPDDDAPVEGVVSVMDLAMQLEINAVLAAEE